MTGHMTYKEGFQKYIDPLFNKYKGGDTGFYRCLIYLVFARRYDLIDSSSLASGDANIYASFFDLKKAQALPSHPEILVRISSFFSYYWGKSHQSYSQFSAIAASISEIDDVWLEDNYAQLVDSLINQMVSRAGKGEVEFIQPEEVTSIVVALSDYSGQGEVYNPYAGSGSYGIALNVRNGYIAQEYDPDNWVLGVIRLLAHGIDATNYTNADSVYDWQGLTNPSTSGTQLETPDKRFELIISTPPFKAPIGSSREMRESAFPYRFMEEDFINRGLDGLTPDGTLIGLFASYVLYQTGKSWNLRRRFIDEDLLDTVLLLPGELFSSTSIQTVILKFKKNKRWPGKVRFVDGSTFYNEKFFRRVPERGRTLKWKELLDDLNLSESNYVKYVSSESIKSNDYSLDLQSYFGVPEYMDIPEGYDVKHLSDLIHLVDVQKVSMSDVTGRKISSFELNEEPFHWLLDIDSVGETLLEGTYKRVDFPALLMSSFSGRLRPTYINASAEKPIFVPPGMFTASVDTSLVEVSYLCFLIAKKNDTMTSRSMSPVLSPNIILGLTLAIAPLEMQSGLYAAAEDEYMRGLVEKHGLEKLIERQKNEFKQKLRGRKHDLRNSFRGLKGDFNAIKGYVLTHEDSDNKPLADAVLNPNTGATLVGKLNSILRAFDKISYFIEELDREETFGYPSPVNLVEKLQKLSEQNSTIYRSSFRWDKTVFSQLNENDSPDEAFVNIAPEDLDKVLDNILQNAVTHGFTDPERADYCFDIELDYEKEGNQYVIFFRNNGNPLPKGIDTVRYGMLHEKAGDHKGEGTGGFIVKSIVEHFGGSYSVNSALDQDYTVSIAVKLPRYDRQ